ncbi:MFS transporter [Litchfieldella xinjiangensis]|uniref:MFS transporter n=1 Tax=Litchfieldella xinjiangensis TaxID=1166948 RepID=UPI0009DDEC34|nr:MFS transporter [Halomonas xinjiangensis]
MSSCLLLSRRFTPLLFTQILAVFNAAQLAVSLCLLGWDKTASPHWQVETLPWPVLIGLALVVFAVSSWSGLLGDRLDMRRPIRRAKLVELLAMLVAVPALMSESVVGLAAALSFAAAGLAILGPVRAAILPRHLAPTEWLHGNAWLLTGTFLALPGGAASAAVLWQLPGAWRILGLCLALVGIALAGLVTSFKVPSAAPRHRLVEKWHPWRSSRDAWRHVLREKHLRPAMLGLMLFWFFMLCVISLLPALASNLVGPQSGTLYLLFTGGMVGVAVGALLCAVLSAGRLETGLVTLGVLVAGLGCLFLASLEAPATSDVPAPGSARYWLHVVWVGCGLMITGMGAALFAVPLYTLLQTVSREEWRARTLGATQMVCAVSIPLWGGYLALVPLDVQAGARWGLLGLGVLALLLGVGLLVRRPRPVLRLLVFALVHVIYRMRFQGRHHIPVRGAALVVCNHVSFMDALVLGGASPRPLRFLMDQPIYESPWLNWWFRIVGAIPVDSDRRDPGNVRRALNEVSHALRQGEVVMLFPEGRLTPDGEIQRFRRGLDMILARDPVPVVPAGLAGLWGSWTSHCGGRALTKPPRRFRARVALVFGEPLAPRDARSGLIEHRVRDLKAEADDWLSQGKPRIRSG